MQKLRSFARDFLALVLILATISGAYVGAAAIDALWAFWILAPASLALVGLKWLYTPFKARAAAILKTYRDGKKFEGALRAAAKSEDEACSLREQLKVALDDLETMMARGEEMGRRRVVGEILSQGFHPATSFLSVGCDEKTGQLLVGVEFSPDAPLPLGSMWRLRVRGLGSVKAIMYVRDYVGENAAILAVEQIVDRNYVSDLIRRAATNNDVPSSLELCRREFTDISDLLRKD